MRKILRRVLLGLLVLAVVLAVLVVWWVRRPWPQLEGTVEASGVDAPVEILRDAWGVPHIYAASADDLFFAQGWVHAQDRLWQMEFTRRVGHGRLSEVLGPPLLGFDRATRTLGLLAAAEREWQAMVTAGGEPQRLLRSYVDGVNACLESQRGRLALEFSILGVDPEPWTPVDVLVTIKVLYWLLAENASFEISRFGFLDEVDADVIREILPPYREGAPVIVPPELLDLADGTGMSGQAFQDLAPILGEPGPGQGSNNWVISGDRTATGRPLLANDTHLELYLPSLWYANGLHGGGFDVVGYSLAGAPAVIVGHNDRIAWGVSDLVPDVEDVYLERFDDEDNPTRYEYQGEWRDLEIEDQTIEIRDGEPVELRILRTHHGPILNDFGRGLDDAPPAALRWAGERGATAMRSIFDLNRAGDWESFRQAISFWDGPHMNFGYADVDGNIGYQASGLIPIRNEGHTGATPVPGWTGEHEWQGYIPYEELPWMLNPPEGLVITANQKVVDETYPYPLGYEYADPFRALRIAELLEDEREATLEGSAEIQGDTFHLPAEALVPHLLAVEPADDLEARALDEVRDWNLRLDPDETGALIYQVWYRQLVQTLVEDELGDERAVEYLEYYWVHAPVMVDLMAAGTSALFDDVDTPDVTETREDVAAESLGRAVAWISERLGGDPSTWRWGRIHTLTFRHRPLGLAGIPVISSLFNSDTQPSPAGDRFTVNAAWFTIFDPDNPLAADSGAAQRILIDVGEWDRTLGVNSTGQSEHLFHPHREDQIPLWRNLEYHPLPFSRPAVEEAVRHRLILEPIPEGHDG